MMSQFKSNIVFKVFNILLKSNDCVRSLCFLNEHKLYNFQQSLYEMIIIIYRSSDSTKYHNNNSHLKKKRINNKPLPTNTS